MALQTTKLRARIETAPTGVGTFGERYTGLAAHAENYTLLPLKIKPAAVREDVSMDSAVKLINSFGNTRTKLRGNYYPTDYYYCGYIKLRVQQRAPSFVAYRIYGSNGKVLYVGYTQNLKRRLIEHKNKFWFDVDGAVYGQVFAVDTCGIRDRKDASLAFGLARRAALEEEARLIRKLQPPFNQIGKMFTAVHL